MNDEGLLKYCTITHLLESLHYSWLEFAAVGIGI